MSAAAFAFYLRFQPKGSLFARIGLATSRGLLLAVLFITLADPVLRLRVVNEQKPYVYVIFDGTDSMAIEDELPEAQRKALVEATGFKETAPSKLEKEKDPSKTDPAAPSTGQPTRMDYVKALLNRNDNVLAKLQSDKKVKLEAFLFDFDGDLYGQTLEVAFVDFIRAEEKFASVEALVARMDEDARLARTMTAGRQAK